MGDSSTGKTIETHLQKLRDAIWQRRPILGEIMRKHGGMILFDYAKDFMDVNDAPGLDPSKPELIEVFCELLEQRLGKEVAEKTKKQLLKYALVSTADHHSVIDHPFWINANFISALPFLEKPSPEVNSLVVFSFASVSLNNASGFARGILFHGGMGNSSNLIRLPLLPDKLKMGIVYSMRGFTKDDVSRAIDVMREKEKNGEITPERGENIVKLLETEFCDKDVLAAPDLSSQITILNYRLWPRLFHPGVGQPAGRRMLDLIYFEIETLVTELLLRRHLHGDTLLTRFLFTPDFQRLNKKYFDGIAGAFCESKAWGTYMFWGIDKNFHRVRMELKNGKLVSETQPELNVDFTPDAIAEALRKKTIYPSMLLCYVMVSLYYGMKCLGGFCQVHDLTVTKEAWQKILREMGEGEEADAVTTVQTKELGGDGMVLAYTRSADNKQFFPATGIDLLFSEKDTSVEKYLDRSKVVTMQEMMNPMLPEMYTVLYTQDERDKELLSVSPEQIMLDTGLQEKLFVEAKK